MIRHRPQANSVVERLNRTLGNSLRALLIDYEQEKLDRLLLQIVRTLRVTLHRVMGKTANILLMGGEARLPPNIHHPVETSEYTTDEYIVQLKERLDAINPWPHVPTYTAETKQAKLCKRNDMAS